MPRDTDRTLARVCLVAAVLWATALPLAPWAASRDAAALTVASAAMYSAGAVICHQRPERSFASWMRSWPVCARCTGIYMGAALAAALALSMRWRVAAAAPSTATLRPVLIAAALPSLATLVFEWTTGLMPSNAIRFLAGLPIGVAVIVAIAAAGESGGTGRLKPVR